MTLVILGFGEAASRRREHRAFYLAALVVVSVVVLAEVGWAAHGVVACGNDRQCIAEQEIGQLYFFLGWTVLDCLVTANFVFILYTSLATLHKARWHLLALGARSLAIIILAIVGLVRRDRLTREAQVDVALAISVWFLVVKTFRSLVFTSRGATIIYPSRKQEQSGERKKGSLGRLRSGHSTSSQQHINVPEERGGSDEVNGDIELDVIYVGGGSKTAQRSDASQQW